MRKINDNQKLIVVAFDQFRNESSMLDASIPEIIVRWRGPNVASLALKLFMLLKDSVNVGLRVAVLTFCALLLCFTNFQSWALFVDDLTPILLLLFCAVCIPKGDLLGRS